MTKRTDVHAPSKIIPDDYEFVAAMTRADSMESAEFINHQRKVLAAHKEMTGGQYSRHDHKGGCHVCGAYMIDYAVFHHHKTNTYIITGFDCADKLEGGDPKAFKAVRDERRALQAAKAGRLKAQGLLREQKILTAVEDQFVDRQIGKTVLYFDGEDRKYDTRLVGRIHNAQSIIGDIVRKLIKYGELSDKQWSFLKKLLAQVNIKAIDAEQDKLDEENANKVPAPTGKVEVTGKILNIKVVDGYYGTEVKCLIEDDRGFKVWGTHSKKMDDLGLDIGHRVSFVATLEVKGDDESFAIFKRPSKVKKA